MELRTLSLLVALVALIGSGCQPSVELPQEPTPTETASELDVDDADEPATTATPEVESPPEEPSVVGIEDFEKGKRLRESKYQTSRALAVRFTAEQRYIMMNKDYALKLYQAEHGEFPKTHEEFMEKIIKSNQLQLPELEVGYEYLYKPEDPMNLYKVPVEQPAED